MRRIEYAERNLKRSMRAYEISHLYENKSGCSGTIGICSDEPYWRTMGHRSQLRLHSPKVTRSWIGLTGQARLVKWNCSTNQLLFQKRVGSGWGQRSCGIRYLRTCRDRARVDRSSALHPHLARKVRIPQPRIGPNRLTVLPKFCSKSSRGKMELKRRRV